MLRGGRAVPWERLRPVGPRPARELSALLSHAGRIDTLLRIHAEHASHFDQAHVGMLWRRLGSIASADVGQREWARRHGEYALDGARKTTLELAPALQAPTVGATAEGIWRAGLGFSPAWDDVWRMLEATALARVDDLSGDALARIAVPFARVPERGIQARRRLLDTIATLLVQGGRFSDVSSRDVVRLARTYASAGHSAPSLAGLMVVRAARSTTEFGGAQLTKLIQALARLGAAEEAERAGLFRRAAQEVDTLDASSLAGLAWSLAHARVGEPKLYRRIAAAAVNGLRSFHTADLAALTHAFAVAPLDHNDSDVMGEQPPYVQQLFELLARATALQAETLRPHDLVSLTRAFATAERAGRIQSAAEPLGVLSAAARTCLDAFSGSDLALLAHALSSVGQLDDALLKVLAAKLVPRLDELATKELVALTVALRGARWSLVHNSHLLGMLGSQLYERQAELTDEERSAVARSFGAMGQPSPVDSDIWGPIPHGSSSVATIPIEG